MLWEAASSCFCWSPWGRSGGGGVVVGYVARRSFSKVLWLMAVIP